MDQDENTLLALEIATPHIFQEWQRRAKASPAWRDYFLLLNAFGEALRRAPYSSEACDGIDLVGTLNLELACLSDVLSLLFPDGVMREKSYEIVQQDMAGS